ncbi:MAG: radical SAM protein [Bacteroidales bacterium]|nr:radical SAM protein [Bacteroidales bacterium]
MRCNYCYEFKRDVVNVNNQISSEQIEKLIERVAQLFPESHILWMLHGGEPFINGIDYYDKFCKALKSTNLQYNVDFKTAIQTNATLLNEKWIEKIAEHSDLLSERILSISIDGPKEINDLARVTLKGASTFEILEKVFEMLNKSQLKYTTISVVGKHNKDKWSEVYKFIKSLRPTFSKFIPCYNFDSHGYTEKLGITPMDYAWFMTQMFDIWIKDIDTDLLIDPFVTIIRKISGKEAKWCEYRKDKCEHFISIYPNGDMWLCDTYNQETMSQYANMGNIFLLSDDDLKTNLENPLSKCDYNVLYHHITARCRDCEYDKYCAGGCIPMRYDLMQKSHNIYEEYCNGRKFLIDYVKNAVNQTKL